MELMEEKKSFVRFETRAKEDRQGSILAGHYVAVDVDFCIITPAGGNLVVEREVDAEVKARFGPQYQAWKSGQEEPESGTSIKHWPIISPAQVENLLSCNIRTVEELAGLSQQSVQRLGMGGGTLKERAKVWLESANSTGKIAEKIHALELENKRLAELVSDQAEALDRLNVEKPKRGRPVK